MTIHLASWELFSYTARPLEEASYETDELVRREQIDDAFSLLTDAYELPLGTTEHGEEVIARGERGLDPFERLELSLLDIHQYTPDAAQRIYEFLLQAARSREGGLTHERRLAEMAIELSNPRSPRVTQVAELPPRVAESVANARQRIALEGVPGPTRFTAEELATSNTIYRQVRGGDGRLLGYVAELTIHHTAEEGEAAQLTRVTNTFSLRGTHLNLTVVAESE